MKMNEENKKILGHGIYLEFVSNDNKGLAQFLLTPGAKTSDGLVISPCRFFRLIRAYQSRGNWSMALQMGLYTRISRQQEKNGLTPSYMFPSEDEFNRGIVTTEIRDYLYKALITEDSMKFFDSYLESTSANWQWKFSGDPFVVPVSEADLKTISSRNTPQNLMNRVKKIREAKNFPERLAPVWPETSWTYAQPISNVLEELSLV